MWEGSRKSKRGVNFNNELSSVTGFLAEDNEPKQKTWKQKAEVNLTIGRRKKIISET